jgi:hypothetical protein
MGDFFTKIGSYISAIMPGFGSAAISGGGAGRPRFTSEIPPKAKAAPDEMREVARPKRRCGRGRRGESDPPRTFIRIDLSGERGVTRLAMRPEYRTKVAPDAMGGAARPS